MKLKFNLKNREASFEGDVERLIEKNMDYKQNGNIKKEPKKTRYQIRQEEKRKNKELEFKQSIVYLSILLGIVLFCLIIAIVGSILNI